MSDQRGPEAATAESAWRLADDAMGDDDESFEPPRASVLVGDYCEEHGVSLWAARAAIFRAVDAGKLDIVWMGGHVRLVPASLPPDDERSMSSPWSCEDWGFDSLERAAPDLAAALLQKHGEEAVFSRAEEFVECARAWDAVLAMENFGIDTTSVHGNSVVCRETGVGVEWISNEHLDEVDMTVDDYRAKHPAAPVTLVEARSLPDASVDW